MSSFSSFSNKSRFELQYFCDFVHQPYKLKKNRFFVGLFVGNTTLPFCGKRLFWWNSLRHIVWFSLYRSPSLYLSIDPFISQWFELCLSIPIVGAFTSLSITRWLSIALAAFDLSVKRFVGKAFQRENFITGVYTICFAILQSTVSCHWGHKNQAKLHTFFRSKEGINLKERIEVAKKKKKRSKIDCCINNHCQLT